MCLIKNVKSDKSDSCFLIYLPFKNIPAFIMKIFAVILFFAFLTAPLFFQILFGGGIIPAGRKMKFWHVCAISFLLLFSTCFVHIKIMSYIMDKNEIRDGLPFVGLMLMEAIVAGAVVLTILIQLLDKYFKNRR